MTDLLHRRALLAGISVALLASLALTVPVQAQGTSQNDSPRLISLSGTGEVRAAPDEANISLGVVHQAKTAAEAVKDNNAAMADIFATLEKAGIEKRDIQTSNFSVNPRYVYPKDNGGPPTIDGYEVSNQVQVRVRDLNTLGDLLDKVVASGSNQVNGISFTLSDPGEAENEARKRAVADARDKAELYAEAAGIKLGKIQSINEGGRGGPPRPMHQVAFAKAAEAVPIAQGEQVISIQVNISWEIE